MTRDQIIKLLEQFVAADKLAEAKAELDVLFPPLPHLITQHTPEGIMALVKIGEEKVWMPVAEARANGFSS